MTRNDPFIVTLDGPAGVGKSSLARRVAEALGVACLDTGAMFRAVALHLAATYGYGDTKELASPLPEGAFNECLFALEGSGADTKLLYNGETLGDAIRTERAGMLASKAATLPEVRNFLKEAQQALGNAFSLVAEGRDMGTVVFPYAACKIFLDADPEVRAMRRYRQLLDMGEPCSLEALHEQISQRDHQDRNRDVAPLRPAEGATVIDTSEKDIDQVFEAIMAAVTSRCLEPFPERPMRRKDRALSREEAMELFARAEYGVLSLSEASGWGYGVPLSFVLYNGAIYFHSAMEGRKLSAIAANPRACFTVVGETQPVYAKNFTTYFESAMAFGRVRGVANAREKFDSLMRLAEKYLPEHMDKAEGDIRHSLSRTTVYKLVPEHISGKAKRPKAAGSGAGG